MATPGWIASKLGAKLSPDTVGAVATFAMLIFGALLLIGWIMLLNFSVLGHREIAIAMEHQDTCENRYLEADSARARLFNFLTTTYTFDGKTRIAMINNVTKMMVTVYIGVFALSAFVIWYAAGPTYLYAGSDSLMKEIRCAAYLLVAIGMIVWLIGLASVSKDKNAVRLFYPMSDKLARIDEKEMAKMEVHKWTALILLASFAAGFQISEGFWQIKYLFALCATAAACLAAVAYFGPRLYNSALVDYSLVKQEFKKQYAKLSHNEKELICSAARRNMLLRDDRQMEKSQCSDLDLLFGLTEHEKGGEFTASAKDEDEGNVSVAMIGLRAVLSKARKTQDGVRLMRKWAAAVIAISVLMFVAVVYPLYMKFLRMDNMVMNYSASTWIMAGFFALVVISIFAAWMTNTLVNTGSAVKNLG